METISSTACSICVGSTRTLGQAGWNLELQLDLALPDLLGDGRQDVVHQARQALGHRMKRGGSAEAEQVTDAAIQPVHFAENGVEVLGGGGRRGMAAHELGGRAQAGEGIAESVRHGCGHLTDRRELLRLHDLGAGVVEALPHAREGAGEVADLVAGRDGDRMLDLP